MSRVANEGAAAPPRFTITGRKVLIGLVAFFGVIFAVNGALVYFAVSSWPGLSADRPYGQGLEYNAVLLAADAQAARGWRSELSQRTAAGEVHFQVVMQTAAGAPLSGLALRLDLERPLGADDRLSVAVPEAAPGTYRATTARLPAGRWYATLLASGSGGADYRLRYEIQVQP